MPSENKKFLVAEVERTEKLKNDIKLVKNKINEEILSGGGTIINSLSEVPLKIKELNQSSTSGNLARGIPTIKAPIVENSSKKIRIPLNLNFTPNYLILKLVSFGDEGWFRSDNIDAIIPISGIGEITITNCNVTSKEAILNIKGISILERGRLMYIREWIAIG